MKNKIIIGAVVSLVVISILPSCASIPSKARAVENFDANRYLGTWYEIARFDYRFERNLNNVTAQYSMKDNGDIRVLNSGYNTKKNKWVSSEGSAKFRGDKNTAELKVTFFKPFYSGYNVIAIDEEYRYALVAGRNLKYLWLLSREKTMPDNIRQQYVKMAEDIGYDTSGLIWVTHDKDNPGLQTK